MLWRLTDVCLSRWYVKLIKTKEKYQAPVTWPRTTIVVFIFDITIDYYDPKTAGV